MKQERGVTAREEFGARQTMALAETAATAVAAQAKAAVEARYILALRRPREWEDVRVKLEADCKRPGFAAVARFQKPIGKDKSKWPTGPSIRFAEAALRAMGNCFPETSVIYESEEQRIVQVSVTDLEANLTYSTQVVVAKTVERRHKSEGQEVLGERKNSYGDTVYIVRATEDDLLVKQNALVSKALRTAALRLLPGDILESCMEQVIRTLESGAKEDPDAAKRKMIDAFQSIGVGPGDLAAYLGHKLDHIQPAEIVELRAVYGAIKDGDVNWNEVMISRGVSGTVEAAADVAEQKMAALKAQAEAGPGDEPPAMTEEEMRFEESRPLNAKLQMGRPKK
jgi:hypothetical protein